MLVAWLFLTKHAGGFKDYHKSLILSIKKRNSAQWLAIANLF